jgi:hypothetical protein
MSQAASGPQPPDAPAEAGPPQPDRTVLAILAAIAALVIVALAVVFTRGQPAALDEGTPAGVVQRYAAAVVAGDEIAAADYLSDSARTACSTVEQAPADNLRVALVSTIERADSADVKVLITVAEPGGPFGSSEYQSEGIFDLVHTGGTWLISHAPWQLTVCPPVAVKQ